MTQATARARTDDLVSGSDAASESWDDLSSGEAPYIPTGFADLDDLIGGLHGGDFVIVAARPAVGKTSWALSLMRSVCRSRRAVPLIFEMEMSRLQLTHRLVSMESGVETRVLRMRAIEDERTYQNVQELARLQSFVAESLKRFEFALRRKVDADKNASALTGSDEVPEEFRKLVEQYYRSLAKSPR